MRSLQSKVQLPGKPSHGKDGKLDFIFILYRQPELSADK